MNNRTRSCMGIALASLFAYEMGRTTAQAQSQDPVWSSGNVQIRFPLEPQDEVEVSDLPRPDNASIPAQYRYNGAIADRSQFAQYDREGNLLFFAVDGNIYNSDGYLIADAGSTPSDRNCQVCTFKGNEFHVVPVPGSCARYYVISLFGVELQGEEVVNNGFAASDQARSRIRVGVLDLTLQSDLPGYSDPNCIVRGRFMTSSERGNESLGLLQNFDDVDEYAVAGQLVAGDPQWYLIEGSLHTSSNGVGIVHAASTELVNDGRVIMMARTGTQLVPMILTANGIKRLPGTSPQGGYPMLWLQGNEVIHSVEDGDDSFRGEMAIRQVGSELRVAYSSYYAPNPPTSLYHENRITYWRFQLFDPGADPVLGFTVVPYSSTNPNPRQYALDQTLPNTPDPPLDHLGNPIARPSVSGLEFSPSGQYVYFTKSGRGYEGTYSPNFGRIDVTVPCDPAPANCPVYYFPPSDPVTSRRLVETQLGMNWDDDHLPALYMIGADASGDHWLSRFLAPDQPTPQVLETEVIQLPSVAYRTPDGGNPQYRMLNHRVAGSDHYFKINQEACCESFVLIKDQGHPIPAGEDDWTATDNPFCDRPVVHIATELRLLPGADITASGITFKFAENAKLIIERGAKLSASNCTFTSACAERWDGIRVEGNTANSYQGDDPNLPINEEQGRITLGPNTVVEHAWVGVWCARETESHDPHPDYNGGWVKARSSTFRNCVYGVRAQNYQRMDGGSIEQTNRTSIIDCSFIVDDDWTTWNPYWGIRLDKVRHVKILNCRFENSSIYYPLPEDGGGGIQLNQAIAYIDGNGDPNNAYFRNLQFGVMNTAGVFAPVRVSRMHFENNRIGIADYGSTWVNYSQNSFNVADQGAAPNARVGMLLWQTQLMTVEQNLFDGVNGDNSVGIFFVGVNNVEQPDWVYIDNRIYNNTFNNLAAGCLVDRIHMGSGFSTSQAGLQMICGDYTDNKFDIAMLDKTLIRPNQGRFGQWAGNRFFNDADCSGNFDWAIDANWNAIPGGYEDLVIHYNRHEEPELEIGVNCDQWSGFIDTEIDQSGDFIKTQHCVGGAYPIEIGSMGSHLAAYSQAKGLLSAAIANYEGTVDLGETPNLKDAINASNPWLSSANLRDLLLAKHPLSDEVLVMVLKREVPMDNWHLTQILLQNSKLNPGVWSLVKELEVLPPFFQSMVVQAQQGEGLSSKQLLEQEIVQRRLEMTEELTVLGHLYSMDTVGTPTDSLKKLLLYDKDEQFLLQQVEALIKLERYIEAQALLDGKLEGIDGKAVYEDLMAMQQSTSGNWKELSAADKDILYAHAADGKAGAAQAAGILLSIDADAPMPLVRFPNFTKSRRVSRTDRSIIAQQEVSLACFPNPSNASTFVTYPTEADGMQLHVIDTKGAVVYSSTLQGNGLTELDTRALSEGLYQLVITGLPLSVKLAVQH